MFAVVDPPGLEIVEYIIKIAPEAEDEYKAIPVVTKAPRHLLIFIPDPAAELVKDIPVLFEQLRKQLSKFITEAAEPVTARKKSEFVCNLMLLTVHVPATV